MVSCTFPKSAKIGQKTIFSEGGRVSCSTEPCRALIWLSWVGNAELGCDVFVFTLVHSIAVVFDENKSWADQPPN